MKSIKFWRTAIQQLSQPDMMKYQEAVQILLTWDILKKEYFELDLLQRIFESEMHEKDTSPKRSTSFSWLKAPSDKIYPENISQTCPIETHIHSQEV